MKTGFWVLLSIAIAVLLIVICALNLRCKYSQMVKKDTQMGEDSDISDNENDTLLSLPSLQR